MITIKYIWLYVAIFAAGAGGFGASHFWPGPSPHELERELQAAYQQIEELKMNCQRKALKRVPIKRGSGETF